MPSFRCIVPYRNEVGSLSGGRGLAIALKCPACVKTVLACITSSSEKVCVIYNMTRKSECWAQWAKKHPSKLENKKLKGLEFVYEINYLELDQRAQPH